jgi:hypothetical protein
MPVTSMFVTSRGLFAYGASPVLHSLVVSPSSLNINDSLLHSLSVSGLDQFGDPIATDTLTFSSSNPSGISVTSGGDLQALAGGQSVTITITAYNGVFTTMTVTSSASLHNHVNISPAGPISLAPAGTQPLTSTDVDQFGVPVGGVTYTYMSSNVAVATVTSPAGLVSYVGGGTCTITSTASNGDIGTVTVNCQATPVVTTIYASPSPASITGWPVNLQLLLSAKDQYNNAIAASYTCVSSNPSTVASVTNAGLITSVGAGHCTITITATTGNAPPIVVNVSVVSNSGGGNTTPNMPSGMTIQTQTGHITTLPVQGSNFGGSTFNMYSPAQINSVGEWSGNLTLVPSPGTGLRVNYLPSLDGGNYPVNFGWSLPYADTGKFYISFLITFSPSFTPPIPNGIKLFEPRVNAQGSGSGGTENHIIPCTYGGGFSNPPKDTLPAIGIGLLYAGGSLQGPNSQNRNLVPNQTNIPNLADGAQHLIEAYAQQDTNPLGSGNGVFSLWQDNQLVCEYTNCIYLANGNTPGWPFFISQATYGGAPATTHPPAAQFWAFDSLTIAKA